MNADLKDALKHFIPVAIVAFLIALFGSSVHLSWVAIPVATLSFAALGYYENTKIDAKTRKLKAIVAGGIALAFSALAVIFS